MKQTLCYVLLMSLAMGMLFAQDEKAVTFFVEDSLLETAELTVLAPYLQGGAEFRTIPLLNGMQTSIVATVGGGFIISPVWDYSDGVQNLREEATADGFDDQNTFCSWDTDIAFMLKQELWNGGEGSGMPISVYGKSNFHFSSPFRNENDLWMFSGLPHAYPDQINSVSYVMEAGIQIDYFSEKEFPEGFGANLSVAAAPDWFLNTAAGETEFYDFSFSAVGFMPWIDINQKKKDREWVYVYLADRITADYVIGSAVPQFFQEKYSLGRKLRGFEDYAYGTTFSLANNLELRVYGPELFDGSGPTFTLFLDTGVYAGDYFNTSIPVSGFLCSAGIEVGSSMMGRNRGTRLSVTLLGDNIENISPMTSIYMQYQF